MNPIRSRSGGSYSSFTSNARSIAAGAAVALVAMTATFLSQQVVAFDELNQFLFSTTGVWLYRNPIVQLRLVAGFPGGIVAGYYATDRFGNDGWDDAVKTGIVAPLIGICVAYLLVVGTIIVRSLMTGMFPPPVVIAVVAPLNIALPFALVYGIEGFFGGLIGNALSRL
jgi:hypothetical protein